MSEVRETSVETQLAVIVVKLDLLIEQRHDHETRIRGLERMKWLVLGAAAVSGPIFNALYARWTG